MRWKCENDCGEELTVDEIEEAIEENPINPDMDVEDVQSVLFVECDSCGEATEFVKNDTKSSSKSEKSGGVAFSVS